MREIYILGIAAATFCSILVFLGGFFFTVVVMQAEPSVFSWLGMSMVTLGNLFAWAPTMSNKGIKDMEAITRIIK